MHRYRHYQYYSGREGNFLTRRFAPNDKLALSERIMLPFNESDLRFKKIIKDAPFLPDLTYNVLSGYKAKLPYNNELGYIRRLATRKMNRDTLLINEKQL